MKRLEKIKAVKLREIGYSIKEISNQLSVSKSSVSLWVRDVPLSKKAEKRILTRVKIGQNKAREVLRQKREGRDLKIKSRAEDVVRTTNVDKNMKMLLCSMIYWCEGSKHYNDSVQFTNSDPDLILTFLTLLRKSFRLDESKFRVCMHLHSYHNEDKQKKFWSDITKIPESQFTKSYNKQNSGPRQRKNYPGCIRIRYYDIVVARTLKFIAREYMKMGL